MLQANVVPVTALVDRRWFEDSITASEAVPPADAAARLGIIAVRVETPAATGAGHADDAWLIPIAAVLNAQDGRVDLTARLGHDEFALLARGDAAGVAATAAELRR